ncbi:MAG: hypothetical protein DME02_22645 [Candidatus Rokuibacteriota bacterium]|nr:MAG: hypothetical protein DME02_22645 [Candidatus Rokubacteria bacterium]
MQKLFSLRLLVCLVGALALAATAVIGASLTDSAVTTEPVERSAADSPGPLRPPVNIAPRTGSTDDHTAATVVDAEETPEQDGDVTPITAGILEGAVVAVRDGPDADLGLTTRDTQTGDATVIAPATTDISQVSVTSDGGGAAGGEGAPYMGSATGLPSSVGPGDVTSGGDSDTASAATVPEAATFVLVVFPLLAALIVRLRG